MTRWIHRLLAFYFAHWHLRRLPPAVDAESRRRRLVWCRDNCGSFAGRWFATGALAWVVGFTPLSAVLPAEAGFVLPVVFLAAFTCGIWHMVWQITAQSRVGLPPIDPPVRTPHPHDTRDGDGDAGRGE